MCGWIPSFQYVGPLSARLVAPSFRLGRTARAFRNGFVISEISPVLFTSISHPNTIFPAFQQPDIFSYGSTLITTYTAFSAAVSQPCPRNWFQSQHETIFKFLKSSYHPSSFLYSSPLGIGHARIRCLSSTREMPRYPASSTKSFGVSHWQFKIYTLFTFEGVEISAPITSVFLP